MFALRASAPTFSPAAIEAEQRTVIDLALSFDCGASITESDYSAPSSPRSAASVAGDDDLILFGKAPAPAPAPAPAAAAPAPAPAAPAARARQQKRKPIPRSARGQRPTTGNTVWGHLSKQLASAERSKPAEPAPKPARRPLLLEDLLSKKPQVAPAAPKPAPAARGACPYPPTSLEANRWYKEHGRR